MTREQRVRACTQITSASWCEIATATHFFAEMGHLEGQSRIKMTRATIACNAFGHDALRQKQPSSEVRFGF
jgi:hypothetical protein